MYLRFSPIEKLPQEIFETIAENLDPRTAIQLSKTSTTLEARCSSSNNILWFKIMQNGFNFPCHSYNPGYNYKRLAEREVARFFAECHYCKERDLTKLQKLITEVRSCHHDGRGRVQRLDKGTAFSTLKSIADVSSRLYFVEDEKQAPMKAHLMTICVTCLDDRFIALSDMIPSAGSFEGHEATEQLLIHLLQHHRSILIELRPTSSDEAQTFVHITESPHGPSTLTVHHSLQEQNNEESQTGESINITRQYILISDWVAMKDHCRPFQSPCPIGDVHFTDFQYEVLVKTRAGYKSILNYHEAIIKAIENIFSTEYTGLHHLVHPFYVGERCRSTFDLKDRSIVRQMHEIGADLENEEMLALGLPIIYPERYLEKHPVPPPGELFNEQKRVVQAAMVVLRCLFGLGDGVPFGWESVEKPSFLRRLTCAYNGTQYEEENEIKEKKRAWLQIRRDRARRRRGRPLRP